MVRCSTRLIGAIAVAAISFGGLGAQSAMITFDADKAGVPPAGFTFATWRQPEASKWTVRRHAGNGYLHHAAAAGASGYSLALAPNGALGDIDAAVRVRLVGGGRAAGLVWRYVDDQHYYAAVLDLGRGEVSLWRVSGGNRVLLEVEDDLDLDGQAWHALRIRHHDDEVRVYLGGIRVFSEVDRRGGRTMTAGRTGVIAQGDAEVWLDDLRIAGSVRGK